MIELPFLPYQGVSGDTFIQGSKGEQGVIGSPGDEVGDLSQTGPCCLTNPCVHTYNIEATVSILRVIKDFLVEMDCQDLRYTCDIILSSLILQLILNTEIYF